MALIEERLRTYTMNSNMNTTQKLPQQAEPEVAFRDHVDNQVDIMSRFSVTRLKKKIDEQREIRDMQYKIAMT